MGVIIILYSNLWATIYMSDYHVTSMMRSWDTYHFKYLLYLAKVIQIVHNEIKHQFNSFASYLMKMIE